MTYRRHLDLWHWTNIIHIYDKQKYTFFHKNVNSYITVHVIVCVSIYIRENYTTPLIFFPLTSELLNCPFLTFGCTGLSHATVFLILLLCIPLFQYNDLRDIFLVETCHKDNWLKIVVGKMTWQNLLSLNIIKDTHMYRCYSKP